ncbi:hypothetical protein BLNAU_24107 [Blattamonas nauphoetae]|uniref:Uncharacterized protein n=1 Tax=Blattamonas nauphoetae TaxID=2049346 RepID=A0ABQ9WSG8_9EUKA|nr:hypothetical protein BLNAU_24107 [Blattamonas nauphoetae]
MHTQIKIHNPTKKEDQGVSSVVESVRVSSTSARESFVIGQSLFKSREERVVLKSGDNDEEVALMPSEHKLLTSDEIAFHLNKRLPNSKVAFLRKIGSTTGCKKYTRVSRSIKLKRHLGNQNKQLNHFRKRHYLPLVPIDLNSVQHARRKSRKENGNRRFDTTDSQLERSNADGILRIDTDHLITTKHTHSGSPSPISSRTIRRREIASITHSRVVSKFITAEAAEARRNRPDALKYVFTNQHLRYSASIANEDASDTITHHIERLVSNAQSIVTVGLSSPLSSTSITTIRMCSEDNHLFDQAPKGATDPSSEHPQAMNWETQYETDHKPLRLISPPK